MQTSCLVMGGQRLVELLDDISEEVEGVRDDDLDDLETGAGLGSLAGEDLPEQKYRIRKKKEKNLWLSFPAYGK